jgi:hypothetical protein
MLALNSIVNILRTRQYEHEDATAYLQRLCLPMETAEDVCGGVFVPMNCIELVEETDDKTPTTDSEEHNDTTAQRTTTRMEVNQKELEKFNVCIFLNGLDPARHKSWLTDLDTNFVANNDKYPKTIREALAQALDREEKLRKETKLNKHNKQKQPTQAAGERVESSFAQETTSIFAKDKSKKDQDKIKPILRTTSYSVRNLPHLFCRVCGGQGHPSDQCSNIVTDSDSDYEPSDYVGFSGA